MDLKTEKILAFENNDNANSEKYNIDKDILNNANEAMANISNNNDKTIKKGSIVTAIRTDKDYNKLWDYFEEKHLNEFETYMAYGKDIITKIGKKKFIDYIDWRTESDIDKWKEDRIKVIPCRHCKGEFTTYQLDFGLCDKCKKEYDLPRFEAVCQSVDEQNPGSASAYIMMFVYIDEFRDLYRCTNFGAQLVEDMIKIDDLSGIFTYSIIRDHIVNSNENTEQFLATCDRVYKQHPEYNGIERFKSLKTILSDNISPEDKLNRIKPIYLV